MIPVGGYVTFCFFLRDTTGGQTPQPICTQNGLNDVDSGKDVPFVVKIIIEHSLRYRLGYYGASTGN